MAIRYEGTEMYKGAVLKEESHMWMDGMEEVHVAVWDADEETIKYIQVGYYGIDGNNLCGRSWEIDATEETKRAVRKWLKKEAWEAFVKSVVNYKNSIHKGTKAEVIRGRKIKKGTHLDVFWVGERETWKSRQYSWMHETEEVAGCYDDNGNKVWIKTDYLKNIDDIKSPNAKERSKFIKAYVNKHARKLCA